MAHPLLETALKLNPHLSGIILLSHLEIEGNVGQLKYQRIRGTHYTREGRAPDDCPWIQWCRNATENYLQLQVAFHRAAQQLGLHLEQIEMEFPNRKILLFPPPGSGFPIGRHPDIVSLFLRG